MNLFMSFFPENGTSVFGLHLNFPTISKFYSLNEDTLITIDEKQQELEKILAKLKLDSIKIDLQLKKQIQDSIDDAWKKLQYPENDKTILYAFFQQLDNARNEKVRIMHFGDSQIEADRITSYVRNELQKVFGGGEPAYLQ